MEKLSVEKRTEVSKMSTERLRARLTKACTKLKKDVIIARNNYKIDREL